MREKCSILNYGIYLVLFFAATALAGCASNGVFPRQNISDAEMAIRVAKENNADINAPLDIRIAEEKIQKARENAMKQDFISARRLADEAFIDAKLAEIKSQAQKIKNMEKELRESIEILQNEVNRNQKTFQ